MNDISDTVMTLAAVACFAEGPTTIRNVAHIRHKETDRLAALATELRRVGAGVDEFADGLTITPRPLHGAEIETYNDHRMAMSMALIGLKVPGIVIKNPGCVAKTYPGFFADLEKLAPRIEAHALTVAARFLPPSAVLCWPLPARADLDPEDRQAVPAAVVLHVADHRLLTPIFKDQVQARTARHPAGRPRRTGFRRGGIGAVPQRQEGGPGLVQASTSSRGPGEGAAADPRRLEGVTDRKTHFVLVDFVDGRYEIQARQHDGLTGMSSPLVRKDQTTRPAAGGPERGRAGGPGFRPGGHGAEGRQPAGGPGRQGRRPGRAAAALAGGPPGLRRRRHHQGRRRPAAPRLWSGPSSR